MLGVMLIAAHKLKGLRHHTEFGTVLARFGIHPRIQLQSPLHENAAPFLQILRRVFRGLTPHRHVHKSGFFLLLPRLVCPCAIQGESQISHRLSGFDPLQLRIAGEIAN